MKRLKRQPRAIIFDMDGVLVDSMPYHFMAWYESLRPFGVRVTCFDVFAQEGERWDKSVRYFLKRARIVPTRRLLDRIFRLRYKIFKKNFKQFLFKGADEVVRCIADKGYALALVTGTPLVEVQKILPLALRRRFRVIISGDAVKKGKPHPEPYLKAARALGLDPGECVVVENAPFGIISAKKAGMFCAAVTTSLPAEYLKDADVIVDSLEKIPDMLAMSRGENTSINRKRRGSWTRY